MSDTTTEDPLLAETVERLLGDVCPPDEVERAETSGWSAATWSALAEQGFAWVGIDEAAGGSGGSLYDLAAILRAVGRFAAPVPIAETAMLGGWCLSESGLELPGGPVTVVDAPGAVTTSGGRLRIDGVVAWARHADRIVATAITDRLHAFSLRADQVAVTPGANLAGEARDRVVADVAIDDVEHAALGVDADLLRQRGALSRILMASGALAAMADMTVAYTHERRQFGKPVATFQAVQQHLVTAAQSAVRARMAADIALRALDRGAAGITVAAARVVVDDAITLGTRAAHQAHGAMGVTREYPLHQLSRRLWSWRHEWGTTTEWRRRLGAEVVTAGADSLFGLVTD
ncbi:MAG: acyl-CoA dehydrogenase family protein [Acidimicrobiia bacterium]